MNNVVKYDVYLDRNDVKYEWDGFTESNGSLDPPLPRLWAANVQRPCPDLRHPIPTFQLSFQSSTNPPNPEG